MKITDLHRRLLADVLAIGTPYPLVVTGGYAAQAHGLVHRLSQDIDVATENPAPMSAIADDLVRGLAERGWRVGVISVDPLAARLMATSADSGEQCEIDVLKERHDGRCYQCRTHYQRSPARPGQGRYGRPLRRQRHQGRHRHRPLDRQRRHGRALSRLESAEEDLRPRRRRFPGRQRVGRRLRQPTDPPPGRPGRPLRTPTARPYLRPRAHGLAPEHILGGEGRLRAGRLPNRAIDCVASDDVTRGRSRQLGLPGR